MRLPGYVVQSVNDAGVKVYYADRRITKFWNESRDRGEPVSFGGWYWQRESRGRIVETDEEGPFRSESAAIRDAWKKLQLRKTA